MKKRGMTRNRSARDFACMTRALIPRNRSGQMTLSFGMIFSIILIIVFLAFGFYAIKIILDLQSSTQIKTFSKNFQEDVETLWRSAVGNSVTKTYFLPAKITSVCFQDEGSKNLYFVSKDIIDETNIEYIDIENTLNGKDSLCIPNVRGKVIFRLVKEDGEIFVTITK